MTATRAVVLARGLGTRMRASDPGASLTPAQQIAADAGLKALIPVNGRPFLDYVLSNLADAGVTDVALVVAPEHGEARRYYPTGAELSRIRLSFVVQPEALGTADAVLAAERWVNGVPFLTLNADNLYPTPALEALVGLDEPGLPVFASAELVRSGNITADRVRTFALVDVDAAGYLSGIVEKPPGSAAVNAEVHSGRDALISMNCWRFDSRIFRACRDVPRSPRGEFELPEAVGLAIRLGVRFRALRTGGPVLDLSRRADAVEVARRLEGVVPRP
jgi:glucose-1-phosphate thymidylyltransferase